MLTRRLSFWRLDSNEEMKLEQAPRAQMWPKAVYTEKNLDIVDSEENFLNQHHGLLNPFKHVPTIQFDETGSMTVADVPLVSEPTSCILNPRRDEALAPPSMNSVQIDQPDEAPGGQAQVTSSIQVRRSQRRRNQPIYNEQLLAARLPRLVRRRNTARDSHYRR